MMKPILPALLLVFSTALSGQQADSPLGQTKDGQVTFLTTTQNNDTTFLLLFPNEMSGTLTRYRIADTALFKQAISDVLSDRQFRVRYNDATITNNGKGHVIFTSADGSLSLSQQEYDELFNQERPPADVRATAPAPPRVQRQPSSASQPAIITTPASSPTPKPVKREKLMRFYTNLQFSYATNDYVADTLGGHAGGVNLSMGVYFKYGFTVGFGAGVFGAVEDEVDLEHSFHYPVYVELQYTGKPGKFAPYASVQAGMVISSIEDIDPVDQNEDASYLSGKAGIAIPLSKRKKSKFLLYGGASIVNVADKNVDNTFWVAGLGFSF